jgi:hypothetical protein
MFQLVPLLPKAAREYLNRLGLHCLIVWQCSPYPVLDLFSRVAPFERIPEQWPCPKNATFQVWRVKAWLSNWDQ